MSIPVVIKIGGSLLNEPGVFERIGQWLDATRQEGQTRLLIAGGGKAVEALRDTDAANPLPEAETHWAAIQMMDTHTRLLPLWLPPVRSTDQLPSPGGPAGDWAFVCEPFLRQAEPQQAGERLSVGWNTTSDSIAARLAEIVQGHLVLLKHTVDADHRTLAEAARAGVVDTELPRHAASLQSVRLLGVTQPGLPLEILPD